MTPHFRFNPFVLFVVILLFTGKAIAEDKVTSATRVASAPVIDGVLDDAVWAKAVVVDDLHQINPVEFAEPSEKTEFLLLYDDDALYVGVRAYDSEPERITANVLRQGETIRGEDRVRVLLSPFNDKRSGYFFFVNPNEVRLDGIYKDLQFDGSWTGIWHAKATTNDDGWIAEFRIPFKTLSFNAGEDWGINFTRQIVRRGELLGWESRDRQINPSTVGTLTGLSGLSQGAGLDIVPSVSATRDKSHVTGDDSSNIEPSLDVFYKVTPGLNASLTINTDFSASEVDNRQVNLTRFNLFFPEKRAFFLRESDIFDFGAISGDAFSSTFSRADTENGRPYFSRLIGLSEDGQPVDIEVGAKLSGRAGRWNIGVQGIRQAEFETVAATDILVARISANILAESTVGFIVTDGDPQSNLDNTVIGVDYLYKNSRLPGNRRLNANFWYQVSETTGLDGDDAAYGIELDSPNNTGWRGGAGLKVIQKNFDPAIGFISRAGIEHLSGDVGYTYRLNGELIRNVSAGIDAQRIDLIDGGLQSQSIIFKALELETPANDKLRISYISNKENLLEPFEVSEGVFIPAGSYDFGAPELRLDTAIFRVLSATIKIKDGDFFNGEISSVDASLAWQPSRYFRAKVSFRIDDVKLPQGNFITRLASTKFDIVFSSRLSWVNLFQYDNISNTIGINSRIHWVPQAGRNLYFVVNRNYQEDVVGSSFSAVDTDVTLKVEYTFRF